MTYGQMIKAAAYEEAFELFKEAVEEVVAEEMEKEASAGRWSALAKAKSGVRSGAAAKGISKAMVSNRARRSQRLQAINRRRG